MNFKQIVELTAQDMTKVNTLMHKQLDSKVSLIKKLGYYINNSGGKRIRPIIAILTAQSLHYQGKQHITIAALIEFIHNATLLHDDVIDKSNIRRGQATANAIFGNAASILVGDFIYTRAFQMMTTLKSLQIFQLMSDAVNIIAEGEVLQLMHCNNPNITIDNYMQIIYNKTARLFEATAQSSAILAGASKRQESSLRDYGHYLGTAFQLIDDLLDYVADERILGKNIGDDLNEGKPTLPLLHAMYNSNPEQATIIRQAILQGKERNLLKIILEIMDQCNSLQYTRNYAELKAKKAIKCLNCLTPSAYRDALESLVHIVIQRNN